MVGQRRRTAAPLAKRPDDYRVGRPVLAARAKALRASKAEPTGEVSNFIAAIEAAAASLRRRARLRLRTTEAQGRPLT